MHKTSSNKERIFGFIYVTLLFATLTIICGWLLLKYNLDYEFKAQKRFTIEKMNRIREYQDAQSEYILIVDSLYSKIDRFDPGINAVYEESDIMHMVVDLQKKYENKSWDLRYKSFLHISEFYYMWFVDKKELWSKNDNIKRFKKNLEECEIGLVNRKEELTTTRKN